MTDQDRFENIDSVRDLYRVQGAERERERIIKLLEEIQDTTNNAKIYCDVLIDLIKGVRDEA